LAIGAALTLTHYIVLPFLASQTAENSSHASSLNQSKNPLLALLASYPTHGYPHYNSTKISKQISSPTQPYEKNISDIYFRCSVSLSNFIAIQPSIIVFCSFLANVNSCSCSLYVVVRPSVVCRLSVVCL